MPQGRPRKNLLYSPEEALTTGIPPKQDLPRPRPILPKVKDKTEKSPREAPTEFHIYSLRTIYTPQFIEYIGWTSKSLDICLLQTQEHALAKQGSGVPERDERLRSLWSAGEEIRIDLFETVGSAEEAQRRKKEIIDAFIQQEIAPDCDGISLEYRASLERIALLGVNTTVKPYVYIIEAIPAHLPITANPDDPNESWDDIYVGVSTKPIEYVRHIYKSQPNPNKTLKDKLKALNDAKRPWRVVLHEEFETREAAELCKIQMIQRHKAHGGMLANKWESPSANAGFTPRERWLLSQGILPSSIPVRGQQKKEKNN